MNSELTNIYKVIIKKEPAFFTDFNEVLLKELTAYLKYNTHNNYVFDSKYVTNYSNGVLSRININHNSIFLDPAIRNRNEEDYELMSFIINKGLTTNQITTIRINKHGMIVENFSHDTETLEPLYTINTAIYDWSTILYIYYEINDHTGTDIDRIMYLHDIENDFGGINNITPNNILEKYNIKPDTTIKMNSRNKMFVVDNTIMQNPKKITPEIYSEDDSFYETYIQNMINMGLYTDKSLEMQLKLKKLTKEKKDE